MLFNSGVFLNFFAAFLLLYWLVRNNLRARNVLILVASYVFYGWWDSRFLGLLVFSSVLDFTAGLGISRARTMRRRKGWLGVSIVANLTLLGFFKYYDFFVSSFADLLQSLDVPFHPRTLNIILPVGISFYTFQAMSYAIDVYRERLPACRNIVNFLAYVAFFPQLVAGPIERAAHLLPQFERPLSITRTMLEQGAWLLLWGMFKKVVIADNLDPLVGMVYENTTFSLPAVLFATIAFGLQVYCDFSGYSDIARGTARLLGFDIMMNFNIPYAATSITEFWRRWHISLSTWLRDYLYITLGGNRRGPARTYLNLLVTMLLGGLWHGAAWNFVAWGLWHGGGLVVHRALTRNTSRGASELPQLRDTAGTLEPTSASREERALSRTAFAWLATILFLLYGWLLFRAPSLNQIVAMTRSLTNLSAPEWMPSYVLNLCVFSLPLVLMEVWQHNRQDVLVPVKLSRLSRGVMQSLLLLGIILFWGRNELPFLYFQF